MLQWAAMEVREELGVLDMLWVLGGVLGCVVRREAPDGISSGG